MLFRSVDVIRRAEESERKARAAQASSSASQEQILTETDGDASRTVSSGLRDVDAMKPVGDATTDVDDEEDGTALAQQQVPKLGVPVPSSAAAKENARAGVGAGVPTLGHPGPGKR